MLDFIGRVKMQFKNHSNYLMFHPLMSPKLLKGSLQLASINIDINKITENSNNHNKDHIPIKALLPALTILLVI
jgi:hypothetical protein